MIFLNQILLLKQKDLAILKAKVSHESLQSLVSSKIDPKRSQSFKQALLNAEPMGLVAEIKLRSPSEGQITKLTHIDIAHTYSQSTADAVSVLTEPHYFGGELSFIKDVRPILHQPILRKDFIIDEYQIYETAAVGADAILLIVALLDLSTLKRFIGLGQELGLDCLVEVHNSTELNIALEAGAEIIGINNRNLATLKVNLDTTEELIKQIPPGKIVVSESGISTGKDTSRLRRLGVHAVLVGISIVKSANPLHKINELKFGE